MRLFLISATGWPYFEHCKQEMLDFLGSSKSVGFVSAAKLLDEEDYFQRVNERLIGTAQANSRELVHVRWNSDWRDALKRIDAILVGGGNTYLLLERLHRKGLFDVLRDRVRGGLPYIGASAGSNVAGPNILTTNDWNVVRLSHFESLNLVPFNINPHYVERSASDAPHSETRDDRIREYHQIENNRVVAIEESAIVKVDGTRASVVGKGKVKAFTKGEKPCWVNAGEDLPAGFMDEEPNSSYQRSAATAR